MKYLILSLLLLSGLADKCNEKGAIIRFQPGWEEGDSFAYKQSSENKINTLVMGQTQEVLQKQVMITDFEVKKVDPGKYHLGNTISRMQIKNISPQMTIDYDSDKPKEGDPFTEMYNHMVGEEMEMTLSKSGEVLEISGLDAIFDKMMEGLNFAGADAMKESLKEQFGEETMKSNFNQFAVYFPDRPVKPGDSWSNRDTIKSGMTMYLDLTYTLREVKGEELLIDLAGDITTDPDKEMDMGTMAVRYDLKGKQSGVLRVDALTGLLRSSEIDQDLKGSMKIKGAGMGEFDANMDLDSRLTLEKVR